MDKKTCAKCCKDMKKDKKAMKECYPTANMKEKAKK